MINLSTIAASIYERAPRAKRQSIKQTCTQSQNSSVIWTDSSLLLRCRLLFGTRLLLAPPLCTTAKSCVKFFNSSYSIRTLPDYNPGAIGTLSDDFDKVTYKIQIFLQYLDLNLDRQKFQTFLPWKLMLTALLNAQIRHMPGGKPECVFVVNFYCTVCKMLL